MGDDGESRKSIHVRTVAKIVIVVKVRVQQKADRFVGPLADLSDVFSSCGRQEAGIHHEHLPFADNHCSIAAGEAVKIILMLNFVDTVG